MRLVRGIALTALVALVVVQPPAATALDHLVWLQQFGTREDEQAYHLATEADGTSHVVGWTDGAFPGFSSAGGSDVLVLEVRPDGTSASTSQFGTSGDDVATGVATDASGAVFVVGGVEGELPESNARGSLDAFARKFRPNGTVAWTRQFGTPGYDIATAVAVQGRSVYVASLWNGGGSGALRKYSSAGAVLWKRRVPAGLHLPLATNASGVYLGGAVQDPTSTEEDPDLNVFLRRYDPDGNVQWTRRFGSARSDQPLGLAFGARSVYVSGLTQGSLVGTNQGLPDAFLRKYDADGARVWTRQWGTSESDFAWDVEADDAANAYVVGFFGADAFVTKFDREGTELWTDVLSTGAGEEARAVSLTDGNAFVAGSTGGRLDGSTGPPTGSDVFVATFGTG
jgi:hypothetical protein